MARSGGRRVAGLVALATTVSAFGAAQAAPAPARVRCDWVTAVTVSGRSTAYCVEAAADGLRVAARAGNGSWVRRPARGLAATAVRWDVRAATAPDGTLVVGSGGRIAASFDGGESFPAVLLDRDDEMLGNAVALAPYLDLAPPAQPRLRVAFAPYANAGASVLSPGVPPRPVPGAPTYNAAFLVPPDYASSRLAYAVASDVDPQRPVAAGDTRIWSCAGDFTCARPVANLGPGFVHDAAYLRAAEAYVMHVTGGGRLAAWRFSGDGTWTPWASVDALLAGVNAHPADFRSALVRAHPTRAGVYYLRTTTIGARSGPPAEQLFVSRDGGRRWTSLGHAWGPRQPQRGNTLPYNNSEGSIAAALSRFEVLATDELVVVSGRGTRTGAPAPPSEAFVVKG